MDNEQMNLFGGELPIGKGNNTPKKKPRKKNPKQVKKAKDDFLKELQEMDSVAIIKQNNAKRTNVETNWQDKVLEMTEGENENLIKKLDEEAELKKLQEELEQDEKDGLLYSDKPFYIEDGKLVVKRYQDQINANLPNLAKQIIDTKWKQNINPKNIDIIFDLGESGEAIYESIVCISQYGVRFRVILDEILEKLNKIPFDE